MESKTPMNTISALKTLVLFLSYSILFHILICHLTSNQNFLKKGLLIGIIFEFYLAYYLKKSHEFNFIILYLYITSWLFYLMVFINLLNSATLKMLELLFNRQPLLLNAEDFKIIFNEKDGLESRLISMERSGFIVLSEQKITLTKKSFFLLSIIYKIRIIFTIDYIG